MTFTDDDLRHLKESMVLSTTVIDSEDLKSLLNRLETAERYAEASMSGNYLATEAAFKEWRQAAGK